MVDQYDTLTGQGRKLGDSEPTAELLERTLDTIKNRDLELGAFQLVTKDRARLLAQALDRQTAAGLEPGPLHGVPIAVKDLFDLRDYRTGAGSTAFQNHRADKTAECIRRIEAAGGIVVGKTAMVEFAFGGWGTNPVQGTPVNPHDANVHRIPGGSSSGSAVAVASGMVPLAIGTDTGGSVRIPASLCGIVGHKSSMGLIPRSGMRFLARSHDTIGGLGRSVREVATLTDAMAGTQKFRDCAARPLQRGSFAVLDDPAMGLLEPEVERCFWTFVDAAAESGFSVTAVRLPEQLEQLSELAGRLMSAESYVELSGLSAADWEYVTPDVRERILRGKEIPGYEYIGLLRHKERLVAKARDLLREFDGLLVPSTPIVAIPLSKVDERQTPLSTFGRFANMLNLCALSVPIGRSAAGLPIGLQVAAPSGRDDVLFQLGARFEALSGSGIGMEGS